MSAVDNSAALAPVTQLQNALTANSTFAPLHPAILTYPASANVGHAMTDPEGYPAEFTSQDQGGSWNHYWRTLYQEAFRFFTTGNVDQSEPRTCPPWDGSRAPASPLRHAGLSQPLLGIRSQPVRYVAAATLAR